MKQFYLAEIVTKDKLIHQGLFFRPKKAGKKAILWVHGLGSAFYGNVPLLTEFARQCERESTGFASFNTRGHDIVTGIKRVDPLSEKGYMRIGGGAGVETFKDCVYDIDAGVDFLHSQGFPRVIVAGHSTGSNKTCYYAASRNNTKVAGFILAGPVSDRNAPGIDDVKITKNIKRMRSRIENGTGDVLVEGLYDLPLTPKRYVSLFGDEDMYDYFGTGEKLKSFLSRIRKPLLVVLGEKDEFLNKPAKKALEVFDRYAISPKYRGIVIKGGLHSFNGKEKEVVDAVLGWIRDI